MNTEENYKGRISIGGNSYRALNNGRESFCDISIFLFCASPLSGDLRTKDFFSHFFNLNIKSAKDTDEVDCVFAHTKKN